MLRCLFLWLSDALHARASGKAVLGVFAAFGLFVGVSLPILSAVIPESMAMPSLDDPVWRTPREVYAILDAWGPRGRVHQVWFHGTWDLVVPVLSFFGLGLGFSWLARRAFRPGSALQRSNLIALTAGLDLLENVWIAVLVATYPTRIGWLAWLKTVTTMAKYACGVPIGLLLLIGITGAIRNRLRGRSPNRGRS